MKKTILAILLIATTSQIKAQDKRSVTDSVVTIKIKQSDLQQLQAVLGFAFQWLPKSKAPASDVSDVNEVIQKLFPLLVDDKPKPVTPVKKEDK